MKKFLIACILLSASTTLNYAYAESVKTGVDTKQAQTVTAQKKTLKQSEINKYNNLCEKADEAILEKNYDEAMNYIKKALEISTELDMAYAQKSRIEWLKFNDNEALNMAQKALTINPNNPYANNTMGSIALWANKYKEAEAFYQKSIEAKQDFWTPYQNMALVYRNLNNLEKSIEYYTKTITYIPKQKLKETRNPYLDRGDLYNITGKYDLALKDINTALSFNKKNYLAYSLMARVYANKNNFKEALKAANKSIQLSEDVKDSDVYLTRIFVYQKMHYSYQMVANDFKKAEEYAQNNLEQLNRICLYLTDFEKYDEVLRISDNILKKQPNNENALYHHSSALIKKGEYSKALDFLKKTKADNFPSMIKHMYYHNIGIAKLGVAGYTNKELINQAINDLKTSISIQPKCIISDYYIGNGYFALGDYKNAYQHYKKYLKENYKLSNTYDEYAMYKYALLKEITAYNNYETQNGKKVQVWATPTWALDDKNLSEYDLTNSSIDINSTLAGRINYSNAVNRIADKNYIYTTINTLKGKKGNVGKIYNLHINNTNYGNTSKIFVLPYTNAADNKATTISDNDYNLILANQYFILLRNALNDVNETYQITKTDVENFFNAIHNIPKNTAANMINDIYEFKYANGELFNNVDITLDFYHQAVNFLIYKDLVNYSKLTKENIKNTYIAIGDYHKKNGDIDVAIDYYNAAIQYGMSKHKVNDFIGNYYFDQRDYFEAINYYTKALSAKQNADTYLSRGQAKAKLKDYDGAIADFNKAIGFDKSLAEAYWARAQAFFDQRKYSIALNDYIKYSSLNRNEAAAPYNAGICLYNIGKKQAAIPYFTKAKEIAQRTGDKDLYQDSVGFINRIKGYRKGW